MPARSKTFLRQKTYSSTSSHLRHAVHLQFISPSRKRLYLAKTIRVVFSQRVFDDSQGVRVVSEGPDDPKYIPLTDEEETILREGDREREQGRRRGSIGLDVLESCGVSLVDLSVGPVVSSRRRSHDYENNRRPTSQLDDFYLRPMENRVRRASTGMIVSTISDPAGPEELLKAVAQRLNQL